jgi:hypothetical protein
MDLSGQEAPRGLGGRIANLDQRRVGLALLGLSLIACTVLILWLERSTTYMADEWGWINYAGGGSIVDMFKPLNQHLSVFVLLPTKLGLKIWGTSGAFLPFKLMCLAGTLACGVLLYAFSRPRVGPLVALAPAMVPMFLGTGAAILLQPLIGLQVIYSLAFGIAAFVALDRKSLAGDVVAALMLILSLSSFSIGIAFLAGVAVVVLVPSDRVRRAFVFVVPALLYGAWRIWANKYGNGAGPELANVPAVPFYFVDAIATDTASLFGLSGLVGIPGTSLFLSGFHFEAATLALVFAAIETAAIVLIARRLARDRPISVMFWGTLAALLALWTIQGLVLVAGRTPGEPRYIYPGAVMMALFVVEAVRRVRFSRFAVAMILSLTVVGIVGNLPRFSYARDLIEYLAPRTLAYTGLIDLVHKKDADPAYIVSYDTPNASAGGAFSIPVSTYEEISARSGPLGDSEAEILERDDAIRNSSDEVMIRLLQLGLSTDAGAASRNCHRVSPGAAGAGTPLPRGGVSLRAAAATPVLLRRFGPNALIEAGQLEAGKPALLRIPRDRVRLPWVLQTPVPVALTLCALGPGPR